MAVHMAFRHVNEVKAGVGGMCKRVCPVLLLTDVSSAGCRDNMRPP